MFHIEHRDAIRETADIQYINLHLIEGEQNEAE